MPRTDRVGDRLWRTTIVREEFEGEQLMLLAPETLEMLKGNFGVLGALVFVLDEERGELRLYYRRSVSMLLGTG